MIVVCWNGFGMGGGDSLVIMNTDNKKTMCNCTHEAVLIKLFESGIKLMLKLQIGQILTVCLTGV